MGMLGKILAVFIVVCAASVWLGALYKHSSDTLTAAVVVPHISASVSTAVRASQTDGYVEVQGTALMDTSSGLPAVPFIQYINTAHGVATKQLIFADSRGCAPSAGDIPCVSTPTMSAYPSLTTGQRIAVKGYVKEDRLLVYDIQVLP
ncbi:MAG: hypothetical protein V4480_00170 [Patescibacteria group bacterium]